MSNESKALILEYLRSKVAAALKIFNEQRERIARLEQENVQLLASHERLREALQRYRRRDDCKCGTCMNADAALREAEKLEGVWTHMRLINARRPESADDKAEA